MAGVIELEIFTAQFRHVHHAFDMECVKGDKNAKGCHAGDAAWILFTYPVAHELALEPGLNIARGIIGAALIG